MHVVFPTHVHQCMSSFRPMHTNLCQSFRAMYTNVCQSFWPMYINVCQSFRLMHINACRLSYPCTSMHVVFPTHVHQCMSFFRPMHTNVCQSFRPLHTKVCQSFRPMHTIVCQSFSSRSLLDSIRKFYQRYKRTAGNDVPNVCWSCILPSQTVSDSSFFYVEKAFVESIRLPYILYFVGKMKLKEMAVLFITI